MEKSGLEVPVGVSGCNRAQPSAQPGGLGLTQLPSPGLSEVGLCAHSKEKCHVYLQDVEQVGKPSSVGLAYVSWVCVL